MFQALACEFLTVEMAYVSLLTSFNTVTRSSSSPPASDSCLQCAAFPSSLGWERSGRTAWPIIAPSLQKHAILEIEICAAPVSPGSRLLRHGTTFVYLYRHLTQPHA